MLFFLYCAVLYCYAVQCCVVLFYAVLFYAVLCSVLCCSVLLSSEQELGVEIYGKVTVKRGLARSRSNAMCVLR